MPGAGRASKKFGKESRSVFHFFHESNLRADSMAVGIHFPGDVDHASALEVLDAALNGLAIDRDLGVGADVHLVLLAVLVRDDDKRAIGRYRDYLAIL